MASRSFSYQSIQSTNVPQPLFGSWIAAAAGPSAGNVNVQLGSSSQFQVGDRVFIQDVLGTVSTMERPQVVAVPDGTHVTLSSLLFARTGGAIGTGDYISVFAKTNAFYIQTKDGNTAAAFVGDSPLSRNTGVRCISKLVQVAAGLQPVDFSSTIYGLGNSLDVSQFFVVGTATDQYLPSFSTLGVQ